MHGRSFARADAVLGIWYLVLSRRLPSVSSYQNRLGLSNKLNTKYPVLNTALLQLLQRLAAQCGYILAVAKFIERVKRGFDHVVRIGRTNRFGQHVLHAH